ncbi:MAG TPA: NrsF family protein [Thermoanaerobaculia bacterium]|nr:NrsF family protein [Thermoanaerobaculia bacterium]
MVERRVPPAWLLGAVRTSLRPVRPCLPPSGRALALLPAGVVLLVGIPLLLGPRPNLHLLGGLGSWGLSALQMLGGLFVVGLALRESVPGRELSRRELVGIVAGGLLLFLALTLASEWLAPVALRRQVWLHEAVGCLRMATRWGLPALGLALVLVARASPTRPLVASAACGLGTGLMADAGMRLWCGISTVSHVLVGHGAAIVTLAAAGALAGLGLARWKRHRVAVDQVAVDRGVE